MLSKILLKILHCYLLNHFTTNEEIAITHLCNATVIQIFYHLIATGKERVKDNCVSDTNSHMHPSKHTHGAI